MKNREGAYSSRPTYPCVSNCYDLINPISTTFRLQIYVDNNAEGRSRTAALLIFMILNRSDL